jgi:DNA uptake protein ComE-like DNA-binding protein
MRYTTQIKEYFTFNRSEQRGILVLMTLLAGLVLANLLIPASTVHKPVDFSGFEKEIARFEADMRSADSLNDRAKKSRNGKSYGAGYGSSKDSTWKYPGKPREIIMIELNSADTFDLQQLRGIGSSFARRIVKYRERLGGFTDKSQLLEIWGMEPSRYGEISSNLTVNHDSIHRIDINTVTFKELLKHPYFPFNLTKAIMLYRKEHKQILVIEELKTMKEVNDSIYRKIKPYLKVGFEK